MRRESSTVVALVGAVGDDLLAAIAESPNVAVARARTAAAVPAAGPTAAGSAAARSNRGAARRSAPAADHPAPLPGWEAGAAAMREAAHRRATYVVVPDDPLAGVAAAWRAMWDVPGGSGGAVRFEENAAETLAAWRAKAFELPDYYLVMAPAEPDATSADLHLGPLRAARPRRVAVAATASSPTRAANLLDTLRSLEHGPWWPPLDELLEVARGFYAGGLAETQSRPV
jgi:hypothetical protein